MNRRTTIIGAGIIVAVGVSITLRQLSEEKMHSPVDEGSAAFSNEVAELAREIEEVEKLGSGYPPPLTNLIEPKQAIPDEPYKGFHQDREDIRDTYLIEKQNIRASSGKASAAASRIFKKIKFVGKSKADVLRLLGDPATISDYGQKMKEGADDPLVYRFYSWRSENQWTISFREGVVVKVKHGGID